MTAGCGVQGQTVGHNFLPSMGYNQESEDYAEDYVDKQWNIPQSLVLEIDNNNCRGNTWAM